MKVIEPSDVQKSDRLLPGSKERKIKQVESLEILKNELARANSKENIKKRSINNAIITGSILVILGLILTSKSRVEVSPKKDKWTIGKILRYMAYALSLAGLARGIAVSDKLDVIEPDGTRQIPDYSTKEPITEEKESDKLRALTVRATLDVLIASGEVSPKQIKNRAKAYSFRKPADVDKVIIKEIVKYGKAI